MNVVVLLRAVADPELARGVWGDACRLDEPSLVALGLGLSLREANGRGWLRGIGAGPAEWDSALQEGLALELDGVVRPWSAGLADADVPAMARVLAEAIPKEAELVIAGSAATDHGSGLLPAALAEALGWPFLAEVTGLDREGDGLLAYVRAGGGRRRRYRLQLPAVVVMARLPAPALYPKLARRLQARQRSIPVLDSARGREPGARSRLELVGFGPARPLTRHLLRPSAAAKPAERLRQLMSGGMSGRGGKTLEATNDGGVAGQLVEILAREGLLAQDGEENERQVVAPRWP